MGNPINVLKGLEASRKDLLDLTARNRLLNTPRKSTRAKTLEIVDELSDEIARILVTEGRLMSFLPAPEPDDDDPEGEAFADMGQPEEDAVDEHDIAARHSDDKLQTELSDQHLQKKLLYLFYDARTHEEEQGVNILYLALGFLKWYDAPSSDRARFAPLILLPCRLVRSDVGGRIRLEVVDEDLNTNLSLQFKLKTDFGIELPELPDREELTPSQYFAEVRKYVDGQPRWEVLDNDIVLSFFSFAKFLMYRDLDPNSWPNPEGIGDHDILRRLLADGFEPSPPLWPDDDRVEDYVKPIDQVHVVDADSSQTRAIEEVKSGRSMIIQGPPGTGKSQTITNLIAAAVKQGKKVLFVAEKMAALEVVKRRMEDIGLGQMCLELHSRMANKKLVLAELEKTFKGANGTTVRIDEHVRELEATQDCLNNHTDLIHTPLEPSGLTPFQVLGELVRLSRRGVETSSVPLIDASGWTGTLFQEKRGVLTSLCGRIQRLGLPIDNPWRGVGLHAVLPSDRKRLESRLAELDREISQLDESLGELAVMLHRDPAADMAKAAVMAQVAGHMSKAPAGDLSRLDDQVWRKNRSGIRRLLTHGAEYSGCREKLKGVFQDEAWDWDSGPTRRLLEAHGHSLFRFFRRPYREARRRFQRATTGWTGSVLEQVEALQALEKGQQTREAIGDSTLGLEAFGNQWQGANSPWPKLEAMLGWVEQTAAEIKDVDFLKVLGGSTSPEALKEVAAKVIAELKRCHSLFSSEADFLKLRIKTAFGAEKAARIRISTLGERISEWTQSLDRLPEWIELAGSLTAAREAGLMEVAKSLYTGDLPAADAVDLFSFAYYETVIREAMEKHGSLATFRGHDHSAFVESFRDLDLQRIGLARRQVASAHANQIPSGGGGIGEVGVLLHEFGKKRRHLPIRKLMARAGNAVQRIKPVFMMSPVSISQFLPPGDLEFDLLLIDEASQVKPVDAFGAVLRTKQIVVVGDDKQLPPTNFFGRSVTDDEEEDEDYTSTGDLESILSLCGAKGVPSCMLRWHYRSEHESLIAVSNREFYGDRLFVVPSPYAKTSDLGVKFRFVEEGFFDRGGSCANRGEARRVAVAAIAHARANPQQSLGIGTFSVAQKDAILDELEHLWRTEEDVRQYFGPGRPDPFFVKNLETIQGDERDVIFISVGYGPDQDGYFAMNFGPINRDGGERRLNVLFSRARKRCEIFTSIRARDIDLARARGKGVAALKTFLHFAEEGTLNTAKRTDRGYDSPFEQEVHEAVQGLGHTVDSQVGIAGFYVDLAVRDPNNPGRYILGIECDGATYHSTRSARDRDRLRQQVLEKNGWIIHRIWSTDWFQDPEGQLRKAHAAIEDAVRVFEQRDAGEVQPVEQSLQTERVETELDSAPGPHLVPSPDAEEDTEIPGQQEDERIQQYICASFQAPGLDHPENLHVGELASIVVEIVRTEGPVHEDEIARRVTSLWGLGRTGGRIQAAVSQALLYATDSRQCCKEGCFYDLPRTEPLPIRSRANAPSPTLRKPEYLPPSEIRAAIQEVIHHHVGASREDTARQVSRMFGFKSMSSQLAAVITEQVALMVIHGNLVEDREMLRVVG